MIHSFCTQITNFELMTFCTVLIFRALRSADILSEHTIGMPFRLIWDSAICFRIYILILFQWIKTETTSCLLQVRYSVDAFFLAWATVIQMAIPALNRYESVFLDYCALLTPRNPFALFRVSFVAVSVAKSRPDVASKVEPELFHAPPRRMEPVAVPGQLVVLASPLALSTPSPCWPVYEEPPVTDTVCSQRFPLISMIP